MSAMVQRQLLARSKQKTCCSSTGFRCTISLFHPLFPLSPPSLSLPLPLPPSFLRALSLVSLPLTLCLNGSQVGAAVAVAFFNGLMQTTVVWCSQFENHHTIDDQEVSIASGVFLGQASSSSLSRSVSLPSLRFPTLRRHLPPSLLPFLSIPLRPLAPLPPLAVISLLKSHDSLLSAYSRVTIACLGAH